jgi:Na+/H+ antiporter NhaA
MVRERLLKILLALVGLLFSAAIYPAIGGLSHPPHSDTGDTMMMAIYFALGIFLLFGQKVPDSGVVGSEHGTTT